MLFHVVKPPPCHEIGVCSMELPELVIRRREWMDYLKYLNMMHFTAIDKEFLSDLIQLTWEAIWMHNTLDENVKFKLYGTEKSQSQKMQAVKRAKKEIIRPPLFASIFKEYEENEMFLQQVVKLRKLWMAYSDKLSAGDFNSSELQHAIQERCKLDELVDKCLEKMYCVSNIELHNVDNDEPFKKRRRLGNL